MKNSNSVGVYAAPGVHLGLSESSVSAVKRSLIYLAAWIAAEKELPDESRQLIEAHDKLHAVWRDARWPSPIPPELKAAEKAVEDDPLASIAFEFRKKTNDESHKEWRAANPPNS